jgi:hypothetical protein
MLGNDGDVRGHPNQPYWNPPPGNGYGFFYDARRVPASVPFSVDFALGGRNQARLRVHALPEPDSTAILAKAPGLYPSNRKATYLLLRRQAAPGQALASAFAAVMAPYAAAGQAPGLSGQALLAAVVENQGEFKYLPDLDAVLLKGTKAGDFVTFAVNAETEAAYEVSAYFIKAPSYGNVCLQVDDTRLGEPFPATADSVQGPVRVAFGHCRLTQGVHRLRVELLPGSSAWFIGVAALDLTPWDPQQAPIASEPSPVLALAERVPVLGEPADSAPVGVHLRRPDGSDEYVFSTPLLDLAWRATTSAGEIAWRGAFVFLRCRNGAVVTMAGHGAWAVTVGTRPYGPRTGGVWSGRVVGLNEAERWVEADVPLPPDVAAACAYFSNPRYSRNTAYRLYGVRAVVGGARLDLGPQPVLLGQGRVHQISAADEIASDIPHDYACSVIGGNNTRFFDGKRLANGRGAETHLRQVTFGTPMALSVDSTDGFAEGEPLYYYDLQIGDSVTIPTAWEVCP